MTVSAPEVSQALGLAPKDAIRYLQAKNVAVTGGWQTMLNEAHARAFTVANVAKADVVADIFAELQRTLRTGGTLQQFKDELVPRLQAKGWWGRDYTVEQLRQAKRLDAEGVISKGLNEYRLKTIYQTNMQSSYMAGRYRQMMRQAGERPYWQYVAILDARTRPAHRALNGRVFRYDDAAWGAFYPPNGFNCRCRVRNFSQSDIDSRGIAVGSTEGKLSKVLVPQRKGDPIEVTRLTDKSLPGGKFQPDPGFDSNPGVAFPRLDRNAVRDAATPSPDMLPKQRIYAEKAGQTTWKDLQLPSLASVPAEARQVAPDLLPAAKTRPEAAQAVIDALGMKDTPWRRIDTPVGDVILRREYLEHTVEKAPDARERFANFILPTLQNPFEVWLTLYEDGRPRRRYISLFQGAKYDMAVICRINSDGSVFWNMLPATDKNLNRLRVGKLLWGQ